MALAARFPHPPAQRSNPDDSLLSRRIPGARRASPACIPLSNLFSSRARENAEQPPQRRESSPSTQPSSRVVTEEIPSTFRRRRQVRVIFRAALATLLAFAQLKKWRECALSSAGPYQAALRLPSTGRLPPRTRAAASARGPGSRSPLWFPPNPAPALSVFSPAPSEEEASDSAVSRRHAFFAKSFFRNPERHGHANSAGYRDHAHAFRCREPHERMLGMLRVHAVPRLRNLQPWHAQILARVIEDQLIHRRLVEDIHRQPVFVAVAQSQFSLAVLR